MPPPPPSNESSPRGGGRAEDDTKSALRLVVLQSGSEGCAYEDHDSPANVGQHLARGNKHGKMVPAMVEDVFLTPQNYAAQLVPLARRFARGDIDCFINLCDGAWDEPSCGMEVVDLLERKLNVPFTGADVNSFEPTRLQMKKAALACGVRVPSWRFVYTPEDLEHFLGEFEDASDDDDSSNNNSNSHIVNGETTKLAPLSFPLLVKHFSSYSSIGLIKDSKVVNVEQLRTQCQRMIDTFGGCLVEEFIQGREFTVLAAQVPSHENAHGVQVMAYEPVECRFVVGEDFKHYNLKWVDYEEISWHPVDDRDLSRRLQDMAVRVFRACHGRGYGRIDVRSDPSGRDLYFLEINPNCGIFYPEGLYGSADFILDRTDPIQAHAQFALDQVEVARRLWKEKNRESKLLEARYDARKESWGLFALRDILPGEVIQGNEESAIQVVSKSHVLKHWIGTPHSTHSIDKKGAECGGTTTGNMNTWDNFCSYCYPISDNLMAMWKPHPDDWKPINHSCDPNAWNEEGNGLNVVARRFIRAGEEICMDYATFCGCFPEMKSFTCHCGSNLCRGTITGTDMMDHAELVERYRNHMTDYVAGKVQAASAATPGLLQ